MQVCGRNKPRVASIWKEILGCISGVAQRSVVSRCHFQEKNVARVGVLNWAAGLISLGSLEIKGCAFRKQTQLEQVLFN